MIRYFHLNNTYAVSKNNNSLSKCIIRVPRPRPWNPTSEPSTACSSYCSGIRRQQSTGMGPHRPAPAVQHRARPRHRVCQELPTRGLRPGGTLRRPIRTVGLRRRRCGEGHERHPDTAGAQATGGHVGEGIRGDALPLPLERVGDFCCRCRLKSVVGTSVLTVAG